MDEKICKIINESFSWVLKVDEREICFQGAHNADYFEEHYTKLGYKVERDNDKWKLN